MGKLHLDPEFALAEPETMRNLLIAIKERWTSITEYFEEAGLTREQLTTLRNKFTYESANIQAHSQTEDLIDKAAQARHEATVVTNDQQTKKRSVRSASFEKIEKHLQDPESEDNLWSPQDYVRLVMFRNTQIYGNKNKEMNRSHGVLERKDLKEVKGESEVLALFLSREAGRPSATLAEWDEKFRECHYQMVNAKQIDVPGRKDEDNFSSTAYYDEVSDMGSAFRSER
eukprot:GHVN01019012.1.p2 GENE.GHVN01019012.1~~GHVN01019012.1.p2  ORF type:complete len:229 (-),score=23.22 GHVN01019012.1:233-919(-)